MESYAHGPGRTSRACLTLQISTSSKPLFPKPGHWYVHVFGRPEEGEEDRPEEIEEDRPAEEREALQIPFNLPFLSHVQKAKITTRSST